MEKEVKKKTTNVATAKPVTKTVAKASTATKVKVEEKKVVTSKPAAKSVSKPVTKTVSKPKVVKKDEEEKPAAKLGRPKGEVRIEKEFHATKSGKFARVILVVACIIMVTGILAQIILGFAFKDNAEVNNLLNSIREYENYGFILTLLYFVLYESFKENNK